jgi:hypothetical protein
VRTVFVGLSRRLLSDERIRRLHDVFALQGLVLQQILEALREAEGPFAG